MQELDYDHEKMHGDPLPLGRVPVDYENTVLNLKDRVGVLEERLKASEKRLERAVLYFATFLGEVGGFPPEKVREIERFLRDG